MSALRNLWRGVCACDQPARCDAEDLCHYTGSPLVPIYARAGERVTCTQGHYISTVGVDILMRALQRPEDFVDWCFGAGPIPGEAAPPCQCGAIWWRRRLHGFEFHFQQGGWR